METTATPQPRPAPREQEQFVLRMPTGLRDRVKQRAEANRRSMNAELILHIENGLAQPATPKGTP